MKVHGGVPTVMSPTKRLIALTVAPLLLFVACSKKEDDSVAMSGTSATTTETTGTTIAPATTAAKQRSTTSTVDTSDDEELAKDALLEISDLPAGEWSASEIESSAGEKSEGSADFTKVESCKELVDDQRAIEAESSGRASVRFSQGMAEEIQIGSDVELWPSVDTVRQIGKIVDDPGFQRCMTDMFESQASGSGGLETSTGVRVLSLIHI
ncbi:MAG: hypothetical protein N2037_06005, partial [Acidimicrobiales bacterium]|nr:hypothetical protein [Acidimicrobiales bacterium]